MNKFLKNINILFLLVFFHLSVSAADIVKIDDGLFTSSTDDGLVFVLEKITSENYEVWDSYFRKNVKAINRVKSTPVEIMSGDGKTDIRNRKVTKWGKIIPHELRGILSEGNDVLERIENGEYWIAFAREDHKSERLHPADFGSVIIQMFVVADPSAPLEVHEAVARNAINYIEKEPKFKNISMRLHGFAARAIEKSGLNNKYMIFTPMETMFSIIQKALPNDIYTDKDSDRLKMTGSFEPNLSGPRGPKVSPSFSFVVKDENGDTIFKSDAMKIWKEHHWLFNLLQVSENTTLTLVDIEALKKEFE